MSCVRPYCGPPGLSISDAVRALLRNANDLPAWPQLAATCTIPTQSARRAIATACALLGLGRDDEMLMPSYNCGTEVEAVRSTEVRVSLYRIDRDGRIDVKDLRSRLTRRTRAVTVIHYFGWPQDLTVVGEFCRRNGLLLFEDCALSLLSAEGSAWLGHRGDAAVFSFVKTLAVPDGGALLFRTLEPTGWSPAGPSNPQFVAERCAGLLGRRAKRFVGARIAVFRSLHRSEDHHNGAMSRADLPADYYWDDHSHPSGISGMTLRILRQVDPELVVAKRRANYARLLECIRGLPDVVPFFSDLPPGVCPLEFPLIVGDKLRWVAALRALGVEAIPWWSGYHRDLPWDEFPDACYLKDHVLTLPVNQDLGTEAMDYVARCVGETARVLSK